jgi:hypothetical protein
VVPRKKRIGELPRWGRSGRRERIRRQKPTHISVRIPKTIVTIEISMVTLMKSVGNYIQS